jgi:hypothetical protein
MILNSNLVLLYLLAIATGHGSSDHYSENGQKDVILLYISYISATSRSSCSNRIEMEWDIMNARVRIDVDINIDEALIKIRFGPTVEDNQSQQLFSTIYRRCLDTWK